MSAEQQDAYADADRIGSDPWCLLSRDNRNHRRKADLIEEHTAAEAGDTVLEVGCGHGLHARRWSSTWDLTAVDLSHSLCNATAENSPEATVLQADATELPFDDDSFDAVVGAAILHHLPDAAAALTEWQRVARQSVTLTEPNYLFLKDLITAHTLPEEQHKTQMAPWRIRETLDSVADEWALQHWLHTPPWGPEKFLNGVDSVARRIPLVRAVSQILLIHIDIHAGNA